ncbi:MAG: toxin HicA [Deltaproteobacteria bacterium]|nr:MAG: toxin HicA [Deltaproteobacteria bacterium]
MERRITRLICKVEKSPGNVQFTDLCKICDYYFGTARQQGSSHRVYKTPWKGDPRINIQNKKGKAKAYQVRQVLEAVKILEALDYDSK